MSDWNLEAYLADGVESLVRDALRATRHNPRQSAFFARFALAANAAQKRRQRHFEAGRHVPAFLIASITTACNLHCAGCYARANHTCTDGAASDLLTAEDWDRIFSEAEEIGVSFLLLAGGEPLLRQDVLDRAAAHPNLLFPVFTNGTLFSGDRMTRFARNRNLVPILSIEGDAARTDARRGPGTYARLRETMAELQQNQILFGVSVTVTTENLAEVTGETFLALLRDAGCRLVFFVEYVPADGVSRELAPTDRERAILQSRLEDLRGGGDPMLYLSFPGDELASGGCLAAGRGFFHINPRGGAEPCPFSPYSDVNVKEAGLLGALDSPLFRALTAEDFLRQPHDGGCALFGKEEQVRQLLSL